MKLGEKTWVLLRNGEREIPDQFLLDPFIHR